MCVCGFATELFFALKGRKVGVGGRGTTQNWMHGGERPRCNLTGLGRGDVISD